MEQLFAQKLRFKNAKGEEYPKWEEKYLFDLGSTYGGLSGKSKNDFGNGKPYITYKSVFDSLKIDVDRVELVNVNSAVENQNKVKYGDIFFTISSETPDEIGMASVLLENMGECYLNSFCFGFRLNSFDEINPIFLGFYLRSEILRNKIKKLAQGSTRFNLSKNALMKTEVKIPSIIEQLKIVNFLSNIDEKINQIDIELENMKKFKKGLLQQMFIFSIILYILFLEKFIIYKL